MEEKQKLIEESIKDTLLYVTLFRRELAQLSEKKIMKTFSYLVLIEQYDTPAISELGKKLNVSKSQMTSTLDDLAKSGLIKRVPDEKDRRIIRIVLTPEGQNFIKNSQKTIERNMNQLLSTLDLKEVEELKKSIETIKNVVLKIQDGQKNQRVKW